VIRLNGWGVIGGGIILGLLVAVWIRILGTPSRLHHKSWPWVALYGLLPVVILGVRGIKMLRSGEREVGRIGDLVAPEKPERTFRGVPIRSRSAQAGAERAAHERQRWPLWNRLTNVQPKDATGP
jgi:hypothetical protein